MDPSRTQVKPSRWTTFALEGLPVLGSTFLLAFAVVCGLVLLPS